MIEHSENIAALSMALVAAQGAMTGAKRDATNPHFKSTYVTLDTVIETAKPALQSAGLAFVQAPGQMVDGSLEVTTMIVHGESGQWMRSTLHIPLAKRDPQGAGSAITYACRYSLMAMLGLPPTDDDGEAAMDRDRPLNLPKAKSSAELKRDGSWERLKADLDHDLSDCKSLFALDKLRKDYRERARSSDWPKTWLDALANEFATVEEQMKQDELPMAG